MAIVAFATLGALAYAHARRVVWPPVILCSLFGAVEVGLLIWSDEVDPISNETQFIVFVGVLAFTIAGGVARYVGGRSSGEREGPRSTLVIESTLAVLLLALAFAPMLPRLIEVHRQIGADNIFASVNEASAEDEISWGIYLWVYRLLVALTIFLVVRRAEERTRRSTRALMIASIVITSLATVVYASRVMILSLIVALFFASYLSRSISAKWLSVGIGAAFAPVFVIAAALRGHFGDEGGGALAAVFRNYFLGGIAGFDQTVAAREPREYGINSLRSIRLWLDSLGFRFEVKPLVQEFRWVPFPANVFTAFEPYYRDFGVTGVVVICAVIGYVSCYAFARAEQHHLNELYVGSAAMLYHPLLMFFFDEQYLKFLSHWLFIAFGLWLFRLLLVRPGVPCDAAADSSVSGPGEQLGRGTSVGEFRPV